VAASPHTPAAQSVFEPASPGAHLIDDLTLALFAGGAVLFILVMALLLRTVWSKPSQIDVRRWLVVGGVVLPVVVLTVLLVQGLRVGAGLSHDPDLKAMEIEVIARRWWWEFRYRAPDGKGWVVLANELHLPVDCAATLTLISGDVIHSFWVPALAGKVDVIPGHRNKLVVHASRAGRFRGQCAEYCGTQHANMALEVVVESPQEFREWQLNQARPASAPTDALAQRGQQSFEQYGCATCHTIRGTTAAGSLGPDLTHVASRRLLAAATLDNDPASLAEWIRSAQHLKPGNLMPSMPVDDDALNAIATYLAGLH
jgi:cytochrome c oxidase subunit II